MLALSAHDILHVWEVGEGQHPFDRALTLLAAACPELTRDELAALSVGQRDAWLLALRERTTGPRLSAFVGCPRCAERLEFDLTVADLRAEPSGDEGPWELVADGVSLRFRLPDSRDLAAAVGSQDPEAAGGVLARRCVMHASRDGEPVDVGELPPGVIARLAQRMVECDPQAEVLLDLRCPTCGHSWHALFDIVAFFWAELASQAKRLLREVHTLARAYGWREADIVSMSARRRQLYLEMAT
jgi:hypothetical protein